MPRKVKRVKVAKGQKQKHTKKFWIILSSIIAASVAAITTITILLVYFLVIKKDPKYDYFKDIPDSETISWNSAKKKINETEHMLVYYWTEDGFDPEDSKTDSERETEIVELYKLVKEYNTTEGEFETLDFCLVDTKSAKGKGALSDSVSGIEASNQLVYYCDGVKSVYPFGATDPTNPTEEQQEASKGTIDLNIDMTVIKEVQTFVKQMTNYKKNH